MSRRTNADPKDPSTAPRLSNRPLPPDVVELLVKLRAMGGTRPTHPDRPGCGERKA